MELNKSLYAMPVGMSEKVLSKEKLCEIFEINSDEILLFVSHSVAEDEETGEKFAMINGQKSNIIIPQSGVQSAQEQKTYFTTTGEVLKIGRDCFASERYFPLGARCKVGDILFFKPGEAKIFKLNEGTVIALVGEGVSGNIVKEEYKNIFI